MKKKDFVGLRNKSSKDLSKMLKEKKAGLVKAYAEVHGGKEKNLKQMKNTRKDIAQILTVMTEIKILESETKKEEKV